MDGRTTRLPWTRWLTPRPPPPLMSSQYIYTMHRLSKEFPPDKQVLKDVSLQFLPGAKIGVLGYNGSGKSTVLKIMAGIETEYRGDAMLAPNATVGLLEQEPHLDETKDVKGNVEEAVTETKALLERFNELRRQLLRGDGRRVRPPAGADRRRRRVEPRHDHRVRDGRAAPAARRRRRLQALRRRAPPRGAVPAAAAPARPAAARRADEPPRRRVRRLARAPPRRVQGHDRRRHPRSLLPRQRRGLDPRARSRARHPVRGQLLVLAGAEAEAPGDGGEGRQGPPAARSSRSSSGCARTPRAGARRPRRG